MTADVEVKVDTAGLNHLLHSEAGAVGQFMLRLVNIAGNKARSYAKVDTGLMRSRTEGIIQAGPDGIEGRLISRTAYARFVNSGTQYVQGDRFLNRAAADAVHETTRH